MSNKFREIIDAKRREEGSDELRPPEEEVLSTAPAPAAHGSLVTQETGAPKRGRPVKGAKRNNPDYEQVTAYIKRQTYKQVKIRLIEEDKEFSELVEEVLSAWLHTEMPRSK